MLYNVLQFQRRHGFARLFVLFVVLKQSLLHERVLEVEFLLVFEHSVQLDKVRMVESAQDFDFLENLGPEVVVGVFLVYFEGNHFLALFVEGLVYDAVRSLASRLLNVVNVFNLVQSYHRNHYNLNILN